MWTFRSPEMTKEYDDFKAAGGLQDGCRLCDVPAIKQFEYWKISQPKFTFDRIAELHHMLLPLRHTTELTLTDKEQKELLEIKHSPDVQEAYEFIIEASHKKKSIPAHFHVHLVVAKD